MPLLKADAQRLSNNTLVSGIVEEIIKRDAVYSLLPFVSLNSKAYVYNREDTIPTPTFIDPNEDITEGASTFTDVTVTLKILSQNFDVDKFLKQTMGDANNQVAAQLAGAVKGMDQKFRDKMINGDTVSDVKEFDGIKKLTVAGQTTYAGTNGGALTFDMLDELIDNVKTGRPDAIFMRHGTYRALKALMRTSGGMTPEQLKIVGFDGNVPSYDGIPVLLSEYLTNNETRGTNNNTCSIYAARFNEQDGIHGLVGGDTAGIRFESIGTRETRDAERYRLTWYTAMVLKSTKSVARLGGITNL